MSLGKKNVLNTILFPQNRFNSFDSKKRLRKE